MRIGSPSTYLEVGATCDSISAIPVEKEQFEPTALHVFQVEFTVNATTQVCIELSPGGNLFGRSSRTSIVGHKLGTLGPTVIGPHSFLFCTSGQVALRIPAGSHQFSVCLWNDDVHPHLENWLGTQGEIGLLACSIKNSLASVDRRFTRALDGGQDSCGLTVLSCLFDAVPTVLKQGNSTGLVNLPTEIPGVLYGIAECVLGDPVRHWSVPEAAHLAGYSPFHFSRVFKQKVGVGFQEFVDRCRTENALKLLCTTFEPVETIAVRCGLGSPQTLRDSLRSYLGLMPSDIRFAQERTRTLNLIN